MFLVKPLLRNCLYYQFLNVFGIIYICCFSGVSDRVPVILKWKSLRLVDDNQFLIRVCGDLIKFRSYL
jgi:hypothetical protein